LKKHGVRGENIIIKGILGGEKVENRWATSYEANDGVTLSENSAVGKAYETLICLPVQTNLREMWGSLGAEATGLHPLCPD
jgi:hypothetical protein